MGKLDSQLSPESIFSLVEIRAKYSPIGVTECSPKLQHRSSTNLIGPIRIRNEAGGH